jgi:ABC-type enterochelin transport system ATPase subunit
MGGVFGILQTAGSFIVSIFAGKIFLYSMLSRLYQVDNCLIEESDHDEKEKSNQDKTIKVMPLQSYQADNKYHVSSQNIFGQ